MTILYIRTFGKLQIERGKTAVSRFPTRSTEALFTFLLLNPNIEHSRLSLINQLWPDCPESKGRKRLNTELWRLRKLFRQLGFEAETILQTEYNFLCYVPGNLVATDYERFEQLAQRAGRLVNPVAEEMVLEEALGLYNGRFCEGNQSDWCLAARERLAYLQLQVREQLMRCQMERKTYAAAIQQGNAILQADPLREEIHCALMMCYLQLGQPAQVIQQFHGCAYQLETELAIPPMPETVALFTEAMRRRAQTELKSPSQARQNELKDAFAAFEKASMALQKLFSQQEPRRLAGQLA